MRKQKTKSPSFPPSGVRNTAYETGLDQLAWTGVHNHNIMKGIYQKVTQIAQMLKKGDTMTFHLSKGDTMPINIKKR